MSNILDELATLDLPAAEAEKLGLFSNRLVMRRAWPKGADRLAFEYATEGGQTIVGQWFRDVHRLERVARATSRAGTPASVATINVEGTGVLLQARGADRRLPGIAALVALPGAKLLVHRPERRAIVRLKAPHGLRYAKIVRPERARALAALGCAVHHLAGRSFTAPRLLALDPGAGVTVWSALPGQSLYAHLPSSKQLTPVARAAGNALRTLHAAVPPPAAGTHRAADEVKVLQRWLQQLAAFKPALHDSLAIPAAGVSAGLVSDESPPVLLHRDFYDKQIFIDADGSVGLLDFDTLAVGEAALDVANALVHLELRALQGHCSPQQAAEAAVALLEAYRPHPSIRRRLRWYADATRLRLVCVYAFRPAQVSIAVAMRAQIGQPIAGVPERG